MNGNQLIDSVVEMKMIVFDYCACICFILSLYLCWLNTAEFFVLLNFGIETIVLLSQI